VSRFLAASEPSSTLPPRSSPLTGSLPSLGEQLRGLPAARLFVQFWGGLAVLDVTKALGAAPWGQGVGLAALVAACSLGMRWTVALGLAGVAMLLVNGFVEHDYGQLRLTGLPDLVWLAVLAAAAVAATLRR
jgi:hypothetical protein